MSRSARGSLPSSGWRLKWRLAAALLGCAAGLMANAADGLSRFENDTVDRRFRLRTEPPPRGIVIIAVDDVTFSDLGIQWPFPRSLYARAVRRLHRAGVAEIVLDIQFTEATTPKEDLALFESLRTAGGAVLATSESDAGGRTNVLGGDANLAEVGARAAASNLLAGERGVVRRFEPSVGRLASLPAVVSERVGRPIQVSQFEPGGALIDYRGRPGTFPTRSFSSLLKGAIDPRELRDKIVVVGATAPTLQDLHPTPTTGSGLMSGPEVQANAIWTAVHGLPLRTAPPLLDTLMIVLMSVVVPLAAFRRRMALAVVSAPFAAVAYAGFAYGAFAGGIIVAVAYPLLAVSVSSIATVFAGVMIESRERARVTRDNDLLEIEVRARTEELRETQLEIIHRLGQAVDSRDEETGDHIERMSELCRRLGLATGMTDEEATLLHRASAMHDVGKIGVPDRVLGKPGRLDAEEWEIMKTHTTIGAGILVGSRSPLVQLAETLALTHHERWDGGGYPSGLAGEAIPLAGRICAVCDVFDALVSVRPYKPPWSVDEALTEIRRLSGHHFDPSLVELFLGMGPELRREFGPGLPGGGVSWVAVVADGQPSSAPDPPLARARPQPGASR